MKAAFENLSRAVEADLGEFAAGAKPLMDDVRLHLLALETGEAQLTPSQREEHLAQLTEKLQQLEDLLEALQLAAHDGSSDGRGPGELR